MKLLQISAPESNSGKTVTTTILARYLKNSGLNIRGFKCGADFIDSKYLSFATFAPHGNVDMHFSGRDGIRDSFSLNYADYGIIEGAMGYFDGAGISYEGSAFDIARELDINTIIVYQQKGEMFSIIPKLKGMIDYSEGRIKGIIFSNCNEMMYKYLKSMVENNLDIKVLGYIESNEDLKITSRNLGLMMPDENMKLDTIIEDAAKKSEATVDYKALISLFKETDIKKKEIIPVKEKLKLAVARDRAFSFHYNENEMIARKYFDIEYFSPLEDKKLPKADFVFISGGYPEYFLEELSSNKEMRNSIKEYVDNGGYLYAEGAGLMYLSKSIENIPMVGVLDGDVVMNKRLQNFGLTFTEAKEDSFLLKKGEIVATNEFHYSSITGNLDPIWNIYKKSKVKIWEGGYRVKNAIASYQHINLCGNDYLLDYVYENIRGGK